ncbi:alkaline phosphatase family protein [bacterium]|nr:alkaline phosphatase family protein [bacterium]
MADKEKKIKGTQNRKRIIALVVMIIAIIFVLFIVNKQKQDVPVVPMRTDIDKKLVVLGFDGMDAELTEQWMLEGKLPNFARLAQSGCFHPLMTSTPPESPVSWSSLLTGMNPGKTNIYDFLRRDYKYNILPSWAKQTPGKYLFNFLPIRLPKAENLRDGDTIWEVSTRNGISTTVFQAPISFPVSKVPGSRMTPGLGVPDAKGTQGTFSFYVDDLDILSGHTKGLAKSGRDTEFGGQTKEIIILPGDVVNDYVFGPRNPITGEDIKVEFDLVFDREDKTATITIQGQKQTIGEGEWSDWWQVGFPINSLMKIDGIFLMNMIEIPGSGPSGEPIGNFRLYMTPINFNPELPPKIVDLSYPRSYSAELADELGDLYWTQGWAIDTWAYNEELLDENLFLEMVDMIESRREEIVFNELQKDNWNIFIGVFQATDRIQHMFFRLLDEEHPRYDPEDAARLGNQVLKIYQRADAYVGKVMDEIIDGNTVLVVVSDHGFNSFRRSVNLNRVLINNGFLKVKPELEAANQRILEDLFEGDKGQFFSYVDWSHTTAYAMGLGQIYLNLKGRETQGIVEPGDAEKEIKNRINEILLAMRDPEYDNAVVFDATYDGKEIYHGNHMDQAPDLVVGMADGYRISWQTCLGGAPLEELEFNDRLWSGDHCAYDPNTTVGIFFSNRRIDNNTPSILDIAPSVYSLFDIEIPEIVDGAPFTFLPMSDKMFAGFDRNEKVNEKTRNLLRSIGYLQGD